jgi:hypothetical protein
MGVELFILITFIDITAAAIIFAGALSERMRLYPVWHKVGLMVAVLGLVAQAFRNLQFVFTGHSPSDADKPLWIMKDLGIAIIAYNYLYLGIKKHWFDKKEPAKKIEPKIKTRAKRAVK